MIAIIDYGAGNLRSIERALNADGHETIVTSDPEVLLEAEAIVLPGVGNAGHAMEQLVRLGMPEAIHTAVAAEKPFLGICVGMQVLFEDQEEGSTQGLGLLPGRVRTIEGAEKLPHIGWNASEAVSDILANGEDSSPYYYFVHSFVAEPSDQSDIAATTGYGERFPSVVIRGNVWGTQFHPEKSGKDGLAFLHRWGDLVRKSSTSS